MTNPHQGTSRKLEGWKEIGEYLNRAPRTVQGWERDFSLPIHRIQGRTYAETEELDEWLDEHRILANPPKSKNGGLPDERLAGDPSLTGRSPWRAISITVAAALAVVSGMAGYKWLLPGPAVDYSVQGKVLTLLDLHQRVVWRFELPATPAEPKTGSGVPPEPRGYFEDIDRNGKPAFLYRYLASNAGKWTSTLYCFRPNGSVRWIFDPSKPVALKSGRMLYGPYTVSLLGFLKNPRADGGRIVVASNHAWDWPQQVVILKTDGSPVDEYWHPGWFFSMAIADLDGDGSEEILLGGVNNAYGDKHGRGATLVVLNSRGIRGQGTIPDGYGLQLASLPQGVERRVLLFKEFDRSADPNYYCHVERVNIGGPDEVELLITQGFAHAAYKYPYAHVQLNKNLDVVRVLPSALLGERLQLQLAAERRTPAGRSQLFLRRIGDVLDLPRPTADH